MFNNSGKPPKLALLKTDFEALDSAGQVQFGSLLLKGQVDDGKRKTK
jgi:hypothetical protein